MFTLLARQVFRRNQSLLNATRFSSTGPVAQNISKHNDMFLAVQWNDGKVDEFPHFYLRENCNCPQCFNPSTKARNIFAPKQLDLHVKAKSAKIDSNRLSVKWTDGHSSIYSSERLQMLRYKSTADGFGGILPERVQLWGDQASFENGTLPVFDFHELLEDDKLLYKWLVTLTCETGIAKLKNIPLEREQLIRLGDRAGYLVSTNYGICYDIKAHSEDVARDPGYTTKALSLHSDYIFTFSPPAISMFHCLLQTESKGGVNQWVDGFHAAHRLYKEDPESFDILTETPVTYRNITRTDVGEYHTTASHRLISLDAARKLSQVSYFDDFRDGHMPLEPGRMMAFYKAYIRFTELLLDNKSSFWYKMNNGDGITVNNYRVLHARSGYENTTNNKRVFQLAFLDWDCVHSKIRILSEQQGIPSPV